MREVGTTPTYGPGLGDDEALRLQAKARLAATQKGNERRYTQHPWPFLRECIWTVDQVRKMLEKIKTK